MLTVLALIAIGVCVALLLPELFDMFNAPDLLVVPYEVVIVAIGILLRAYNACLRENAPGWIVLHALAVSESERARLDSRCAIISGGRGLCKHLRPRICVAIRFLG